MGVVGMKGIREVVGIVVGVVRAGDIVAVGNSVVAAGRSSSRAPWRILVVGIGEAVGRLAEVVESFAEGMYAGKAVEGNMSLSVVTDVFAAGKTVVGLQVILEVRRSCIAVAAPGMVVVGLRSVMGHHYLARSVDLYPYLHVQLDLLFRDPLSLDRDRFHLCCRASLDLPRRGRYDLLLSFLPDPSVHADSAV